MYTGILRVPCENDEDLMRIFIGSLGYRSNVGGDDVSEGRVSHC
jgi:hypothetical protein